MLDSVMKSVRIESGPSGLIVMSFSSFRLKHGYFFGLYDFDMFLAYNYLAVCFGMIFIAFLLGWIDKVIIRSKDDHKVLLASVIQNRVMALLGFCLADTKRREHMDARISVMKSVRIESGPSGLIVMSFSSFRLKHGYFFGLYDFDMFLAYNYLAVCFGMIFIAFLLGWIDKVIIRSKDDHKVLLASVIQNRVMALLGFCLADTKRREHMDARISGSVWLGYAWLLKCMVEMF
ncbi:hypothetical protein DY000_02049036 [Brassica cretica]|uniref:Uncharacterized protein n=1 Tax=Brassica cretica TaxID=69181 RepID=A0ABQ7F4Q7_BRACR|nr:hypothetical protein DY000_02049036 [Brassica cretica]